MTLNNNLEAKEVDIKIHSKNSEIVSNNLLPKINFLIINK